MPELETGLAKLQKEPERLIPPQMVGITGAVSFQKGINPFRMGEYDQNITADLAVILSDREGPLATIVAYQIQTFANGQGELKSLPRGVAIHSYSPEKRFSDEVTTRRFFEHLEGLLTEAGYGLWAMPLGDRQPILPMHTTDQFRGSYMLPIEGNPSRIGVRFLDPAVAPGFLGVAA